MTYKRELAEAIRHVTNVAVWLLEQADQEESRGRGEWVVDTEDRVVSLLRGADQDAEDHERAWTLSQPSWRTLTTWSAISARCTAWPTPL
jgi:hypothetical protein